MDQGKKDLEKKLFVFFFTVVGKIQLGQNSPLSENRGLEPSKRQDSMTSITAR
jgi:hypothetical protein